MAIETNMIYSRAHHYARATGKPFEDLVQEGVLACIEAELEFDPKQGTKLSTWQWWQIERRLKAFCGSSYSRARKAAGHMVSYDPDIHHEGASTAQMMDFYEFMQDAPLDVKRVCVMVLKEPHEYAGFPQQYCHRRLRRLLVERLGWEKWRATEAVRDTMQWFRDTAPPLRRTA